MRLQHFIKVPCNTCTSYGVRFLNTVIIQDKMVYTENVDKLYIYIYIYSIYIFFFFIMLLSEIFKVL